MKGESNPVFVTSTVKANKFMSRLQILLLEIVKAERSSSVMGFCAFDGVYWKKNAGRQSGMLYMQEKEEGKEEGEHESKREKCSLRELTEWEWHKGTGGRSK